MTDQEKLAGYLCRSYGKSYCDGCLAEALVLPLRDVRKETLALAEAGWVMRLNQSCNGCDSTRIVSKRRMSAFAA